MRLFVIERSVDVNYVNKTAASTAKCMNQKSNHLQVFFIRVRFDWKCQEDIGSTSLVSHHF